MFYQSTTGYKLSLRAYNDFDLENDLDDRRSTSRTRVFFCLNLVVCSSTKQSLLAKSRTKLKYRVLTHTTSKFLLLKSLFSELDFPFYLPNYCVTTECSDNIIQSHSSCAYYTYRI